MNRVLRRIPGGTGVCGGPFVAGFLILVVLATHAVGAANHGKDPAKISVLIATGMPGGTYYQVGLAMASLWTTKLRETGIRVSAAVSEGSRENIEAIRIADADMILVEEFFCSMAFNGTGLYKEHPVSDLRVITPLWPDAVHILIRADRVETGTLQDLQGLVFATGLPDSGNRFTTELLLRTVKSGKKGVRLRSMSNLVAADALRKGIVQGLDVSGGIPVPIATTLLSEKKPPLAFLEITDAQLEAARTEGWQHVIRQVIPAGTYPGQEKPVKTVGQMNVLAVTATLDAQVVYELTKSLYENLDYLARVHPACRSILLERDLSGLHVPLHRGAIQYFREREIPIPQHLMP